MIIMFIKLMSGMFGGTRSSRQIHGGLDVPHASRLHSNVLHFRIAFAWIAEYYSVCDPSSLPKAVAMARRRTARRWSRRRPTSVWMRIRNWIICVISCYDCIFLFFLVDGCRYENSRYDHNDYRRFRVELYFSPGCLLVFQFSFEFTFCQNEETYEEPMCQPYILLNNNLTCMLFAGKFHIQSIKWRKSSTVC